MSMFGTKKVHGENTARQLGVVEKGERLSSTPAHLKGTKKYGSVRWVPLERITTREQVRKEFDEESITELADSFRSQGQKSPCIVFWSEEDQAFVIVAGERRLRAARVAEFDSLLCDVLAQEPTAEEIDQIQLVENVQREDLSPMEEAEGYQKFIDVHGWSQSEIAKRTGKNQSTVSRLLQLMKLPEEIRQRMVEEKTPKTLANKLGRLKSVDEQHDMLNRHAAGEITVDDAQAETADKTIRGKMRGATAKQTRVKKARGIDFKASGKKKHTNTDFAVGTLEWCEDLATDKRASVDTDAVSQAACNLIRSLARADGSKSAALLLEELKNVELEVERLLRTPAAA